MLKTISPNINILLFIRYLSQLSDTEKLSVFARGLPMLVGKLSSIQNECRKPSLAVPAQPGTAAPSTGGSGKRQRAKVGGGHGKRRAVDKQGAGDASVGERSVLVLSSGNDEAGSGFNTQPVLVDLPTDHLVDSGKGKAKGADAGKGRVAGEEATGGTAATTRGEPAPDSALGGDGEVSRASVLGGDAPTSPATGAIPVWTEVAEMQHTMESLGEYGGDLDVLYARVAALEERMKTTPHGHVLLELTHSWREAVLSRITRIKKCEQ